MADDFYKPFLMRGSSRQRRRQLDTLLQIVAHTPSVIVFGTGAILRALLPLVRGTEVSLICQALSLIAALAYADRSIGQHTAILLPIFCDSISSTSPQQRLAGCRALYHFVSNSGEALKISQDYPALIPILLRIVRDDAQADVRHASAMAIGTLGAYDPLKRIAGQYSGSILCVDLLKEHLPEDDGEAKSASSIGYLQATFENLANLLTHNPSEQQTMAALESLIVLYERLKNECRQFIGLVSVPSASF